MAGSTSPCRCAARPRTKRLSYTRASATIAVRRVRTMPGDGRKSVEFPTITPVRPIKLADRVYEQILEQIVGGQYREGARLPAEAQLAAAFSVSRPIVRDALARLNADGVI